MKANKNKRTDNLRYTNSVPKWLADAEKRARNVVGEFVSLTQKLAALRPQIEAIQADFRKLKGSQTIMDCRFFKQFCETKLHRTEQAVYAMLGNYPKSKKDGDKQSKPQKPTTHESLTLTNEEEERRLTALNAAMRMVNAEDAGDKAKAAEAKREFREIAKAEPLKSVIVGDLPNHKLLLIQLLGMVEKLAEKDPQTLLRHARAIRKRIGLDDALQPIAVPKGKAQAA